MRTSVLGVAVLGMTLAAGSAVLAQERERVVVGSVSAPIGSGGSSNSLSRETVQRMGEALGLDEVQLEIALEMFKELASERQRLGDRLRQEIEAARSDVEDGDFAAMMATLKEVTGEHQEAVQRLESTFLGDVQAILSAEQANAWPRAERIHRRAKHLGTLTRAEARVNLDDLVREEFVERANEDGVLDALESWAVQVDGLLVERARKAEDIGGPGFQGGVFFIEAEEDPYKPLRSLDGRIAGASRQAARSLAGVLGDDAFEAAFLRRAFARVYRPTDGERRLEAAQALLSLTDEQRGQLDAAADQWSRDVGPARERWVAAERKREEDDRMPPGVMIVVQDQEPTDSEKARDAVKELNERLEARIASILNEQQLAELPAHSAPERAFEVDAPAAAGRSIRIRR